MPEKITIQYPNHFYDTLLRMTNSRLVETWYSRANTTTLTNIFDKFFHSFSFD